MNSISKYTCNKNYNEKTYNWININLRSNRDTSHFQNHHNNINGKINPQEGVKVAKAFNTQTNRRLDSPQNIAQNKIEISSLESDDVDVLSTVIALDGGYSEACVFEDNINENFDIYEPPPKKIKIVINSEDFNTNINEDYMKARHQSNITVISSKIKHDKVGLQLQNLRIERISKKVFSNPLDDNVHGLIGVEYIIKILSESIVGQPNYECALCEVVMDKLGMQNHLIDYVHRLKFCEKHFPTALRQYRQYVRNFPLNKNDKVMISILNRLAIAIEQHHGRNLPYECFESEFNISRHEILSKVYSSHHASEQYGPTFTDIVDSKEVDKLTGEINKYKPTTDLAKSLLFDLRANATPLHIRSHVKQKRCYSRCADTGSRSEFPPLHSSMHGCCEEDVSGDKILNKSFRNT